MIIIGKKKKLDEETKQIKLNLEGEKPEIINVVFPTTSNKPKDCYIYFMANNLLVRLVRPYYEFVPGGKIKIFWRALYGVKGKKITLLPNYLFIKNNRFRIMRNTTILIPNYDFMGRQVTNPLDPLSAYLEQLEEENRILKQEIEELREEIRNLRRSKTETFIEEQAQQLLKLKKVFGYGEEHYTTKESVEVKENERE